MGSDSASNPSVPPNPQPEIRLAKWSTRFFAWLIDFIIIIIVIELFFAGTNYRQGSFIGIDGSGAAVRYAVQSLLFFFYWTLLESRSGQSIGKMALKIKLTDLKGNDADLRSVAIQSFGKSFLLPIDVFFGWLFTNEKRQRIFNSASDTLVISQNAGYLNDPGLRYKKD